MLDENEKQEATKTETPEMIPAAPEEKPPTPRITEEERAQLAEAWAEVKAAKNAQIALLKDAERLDAEKRLAESQAQIQGMIGQQLEAAVQAKVTQLMQRYNIPEGWQINSKTGVVTPPEQEDKQ